MGGTFTFTSDFSTHIPQSPAHVLAQSNRTLQIVTLSASWSAVVLLRDLCTSPTHDWVSPVDAVGGSDSRRWLRPPITPRQFALPHLHSCCTDTHTIVIAWNCKASAVFFCKSLPLSYLTDQTKLLFWKKMSISNNVILYSLSCFVLSWFTSVASQYSVVSPAQPV